MISAFTSAVWALSLAAPAASQNVQTTWAAVAMVFHGERDAFLSTANPFLTPLGAYQAYDAGSVIRTRFVQGPGNSITGSFPINGISTQAIDNGQLYIAAAGSDYIAASAQAFMQSLYPPLNTENDASLLANGSSIQFPLNGYQYPTINVISPLDPNYIWLSGDSSCPRCRGSQSNYADSEEYLELLNATNSFYNSLVPTVFGNINPNIPVSFENAYLLYDYASFQYIHNHSMAELVSPSSIAELRALASLQQFSLYGDFNAYDEFRVIAGMTFAGKVLNMLEQNLQSPSGGNEILGLFFSGYEPFLSFFAISGLSNLNPEFQSLPEPGSIMMFELFSLGPNATSYPSMDRLWVRFLFRNGTNSTEPLISYPLFGRGNSEVDMTWVDFKNGMTNISIQDVGSWCTACSSNAIFCSAFSNTYLNRTAYPPTDSPSGAETYSNIPPTVAGIIGAAVAVATIALLILASAFCCGIRFYRNGNKRQSTLGGFKGAGKLSSDVDVTHTAVRDGTGASVVKRERVGSWELAHTKKENTKDVNIDKVISKADYLQKDDDDNISIANPFGDPVEVNDRV